MDNLFLYASLGGLLGVLLVMAYHLGRASSLLTEIRDELRRQDRRP